MARLKVKDLKGVKSAIRKEITKELRTKETRETIGEIVVESIKDDPQGLPAPSTLDWRRRYDPLNNTDPKYNRLSINFTFTGKLLDDLKRNVRQAVERGKILFIFANSDRKHPKYQGVTKKIGSRSPFSEIEKGLRSLGYQYPRINDGAVRDVTETVRKRLLKALRKAFNV
jgi:hypothetical protein